MKTKIISCFLTCSFLFHSIYGEEPTSMENEKEEMVTYDTQSPTEIPSSDKSSTSHTMQKTALWILATIATLTIGLIASGANTGKDAHGSKGCKK